MFKKKRRHDACIFQRRLVHFFLLPFTAHRILLTNRNICSDFFRLEIEDPGTDTGKLSLIIRDSEEDSVSIVVWGSAEEAEGLDASFQVGAPGSEIIAWCDVLEWQRLLLRALW